MSFRKYMAEFIGTMFLVLLGCSAAVTNGFGAGWLGIAFAFGLTIIAMTYSIGFVSGCHLNPAVSFALLIAKKIELKDFIGYIIAQFAGGIVGAAVMLIFFKANTGLGANGYNTLSTWDINWWQAFIAEVILTNVFVMAVMGISTKMEYSKLNGIIIGLTLTLVHIVGIPLTGTSVNPARSFGPALFAGGLALQQVWVFLLAPMVGALLAAICYRAFVDDTKEKILI